jgi:hypothetical protein
MSFVIARSGEGDLDPFLSCAKCLQPCLPSEAWVVFAPLTPTVIQQPAVVMHRHCVENQPLGQRRVVQWKAEFFLDRLLRQTPADPLMRLAQANRAYYRRPSHADVHPMPRVPRHEWGA